MLEPVIERIMLKSFRSFAHADLTLSNPLFLVGRNGAGKSNFLDAFQFLSDSMTLPLSAVFSKRGGVSNVRFRTPGGGQPPNMALGVTVRVTADRLLFRYSFEVRAEKGYGYRVVREQCVRRGRGIFVEKNGQVKHIRVPYFDRRDDEITTNVEGLKIAPERTALALPLAGGLRAFAPLVGALSSVRTYGFSTDEIREFQDPDAGFTLKRDASNAASVLQEVATRSINDAVRIGELLEAAVKQTSKVSRLLKNPV